MGTDVRTLRPPISHTFCTAQSSWWNQGKTNKAKVISFFSRVLGKREFVDIKYEHLKDVKGEKTKQLFLC